MIELAPHDFVHYISCDVVSLPDPGLCGTAPDGEAASAGREEKDATTAAMRVAVAAKESELATAREAEAVAAAQAAAAVHRVDEADAALKGQQEEVGRLQQQTKLKHSVRTRSFPQFFQDRPPRKGVRVVMLAGWNSRARSGVSHLPSSRFPADFVFSFARTLIIRIRPLPPPCGLQRGKIFFSEKQTLRPRPDTMLSMFCTPPHTAPISTH